MPRSIVWLVLASSLAASFAGAPSAWRAIDGRWEGPWRTSAIADASTAPTAPRVASIVEPPSLVAALDARAFVVAADRAADARRQAASSSAVVPSRESEEELAADLGQ